MSSRRNFFKLATLIAVPTVLRAQDGTAVLQDTVPSADPLRLPGAIGRPQDSLTALENDPVVVAIERKLKCTCGCTLDIYTCRTTDFTCTFSPALHQEVMAMISAGQTPEEIIAAFVEREGEQILMAPPAEGFNLAGYLVPGLVVMSAGLGLAAWLSRRRIAVAAAESVAVPMQSPPAPDAAAREALRKALEDVES
jgi:cytochrome c-type biogenesis protein CcmH/NrfF